MQTHVRCDVDTCPAPRPPPRPGDRDAAHREGVLPPRSHRARPRSVGGAFGDLLRLVSGSLFPASAARPAAALLWRLQTPVSRATFSCSCRSLPPSLVSCSFPAVSPGAGLCAAVPAGMDVLAGVGHCCHSRCVWGRWGVAPPRVSVPGSHTGHVQHDLLQRRRGCSWGAPATSVHLWGHRWGGPLLAADGKATLGCRPLRGVLAAAGFGPGPQRFPLLPGPSKER